MVVTHPVCDIASAPPRTTPTGLVFRLEPPILFFAATSQRCLVFYFEVIFNPMSFPTITCLSLLSTDVSVA